MADENEVPADLPSLQADVEALKEQLDGVKNADNIGETAEKILKCAVSKQELDGFVGPSGPRESMYAGTSSGAAADKAGGGCCTVS